LGGREVGFLAAWFIIALIVAVFGIVSGFEKPGSFTVGFFWPIFIPIFIFILIYEFSVWLKEE
jgi:hypothetical protein